MPKPRSRRGSASDDADASLRERVHVLSRQREEALLELATTKQCLATSTAALDGSRLEYQTLLSRYDRLQKRMEQLVSLTS